VAVDVVSTDSPALNVVFPGPPYWDGQESTPFDAAAGSVPADTRATATARAAAATAFPVTRGPRVRRRA
jgi:hypothetical protein